MKNYIFSGEAFDDLIAPSGGVKSGLVYLINGKIFVAATSANEGELFAGKTNGVYTLPAATHATNQAFAQFDPVFWDAANSRCTNVNTGVLIGAAAAAKVSTSAELAVKIWSRPPPVATGGTVPAATAPTNTTPYGFGTSAQAAAVLDWIIKADPALKAAGILK